MKSSEIKDQSEDNAGARLAMWSAHEERLAQARRARRLAERGEWKMHAAFLVAALITFAWIVGWMLYGMTHEAVQLGQTLHR